MPYPRIIVDEKIDAAVRNLEELELDLSFQDYSPNPNFVEDFSPEFVCAELKNDATNFIDQWNRDNKFGQKIPCRIEFGQFFNVNGFLDLASEESVYSTNPKIYKVKFETSQRSFFDQAKGLPLTKFIDDSCIFNTRYVRRGIPDYLEALFIYFTIFIVTVELVKSIQRTIQYIKDNTPRSVTDAGVSVQIALSILVEVIYVVSVLLALNALLKQLSDNIFAKPRKFKALDVYSVIEKGCNYLGYEFSSLFMQTRFPKLTYAKAFPLGEDDRGNPVPLGQLTKRANNNPIPDISLLEFIEKFTPLFNGKVRVTTDNRVELETQLIFESTPVNVRLTDLHSTGDRTFKLKQSPQFITYEYLTPTENQHVKQNKSVLEYSLKNTQKDLVFTNSLRVNLPYFVGQRKQTQDNLEKLFNGIFDLFVGLNKNYKVSGGDRIGYVLFNSDILPADMIYLRDDSDSEKVSKNTSIRLDSTARIVESYTIEGIDQSQWIDYSNRDKDPLCDQATVGQLIDNNVCYDQNGEKIIVQRNVYDPKSGLFELGYMKRLKQGDFGYIPPSNITVKLISDISGVHQEQIIS